MCVWAGGQGECKVEIECRNNNDHYQLQLCSVADKRGDDITQFKERLIVV